MKERKQGVEKETMLVQWRGWKFAMMRCDMMMRSDTHLATLMCRGEEVKMEKRVKAVIAAIDAFPSCRAMLWSVTVADVNLVEVTKRVR